MLDLYDHQCIYKSQSVNSVNVSLKMQYPTDCRIVYLHCEVQVGKEVFN